MPRSIASKSPAFASTRRLCTPPALAVVCKPELARRIAAQHVALQHAVATSDEVARRHAFGIERRRAEAARQERHPRRSRTSRGTTACRPNRAGSWRAGTARRRTPRRAGGRSATRHFGREQHRVLAGRQSTAASQARGRALGRVTADRRRRFEVVGATAPCCTSRRAACRRRARRSARSRACAACCARAPMKPCELA